MGSSSPQRAKSILAISERRQIAVADDLWVVIAAPGAAITELRQLIQRGTDFGSSEIVSDRGDGARAFEAISDVGDAIKPRCKVQRWRIVDGRSRGCREARRREGLLSAGIHQLRAARRRGVCLGRPQSPAAREASHKQEHERRGRRAGFHAREALLRRQLVRQGRAENGGTRTQLFFCKMTNETMLKEPPFHHSPLARRKTSSINPPRSEAATFPDGLGHWDEVATAIRKMPCVAVEMV